MAAAARKYDPENLFPALRLFAAARNRALTSGFSDNGGAIHSVERILDILSCRIKYPTLTHTNNLKKVDWSERSENAHAALVNRQEVKIEHVLPQRAYARFIISLIDANKTDAQISDYIIDNYRLVLLTPEETTRLNKRNRSKIEDNRLELSRITVRNSTNR